MTRIFERAGFAVHTGPQVEDEFHNFSALHAAWWSCPAAACTGAAASSDRSG
jgi:phenylalanyl-tRNA synthetase alpha subunit